MVLEVSWMLQGSFKGVSRRIVGCFENPLRVSKRSSKGVSRQFQRHFKVVSRVFKESVKCVSNKVSRCFDELLFCNFFIAWISLQKEDLFILSGVGW